MRKSKVFEASKDIPAIHVHEKGRKPSPHAGTLRNHLNVGANKGDMDDVKHHDCNAHELESDIMD